MSRQVLISYASGDRLIAEAIVEALEQHGISCWIAPRDIVPSKNYMEAIMEAIRQAQVVVVVFSEHTNHSKHVIIELDRCIYYDLARLAYRIEDVPPTGAYEYALSLPQWFEAPDPLSPATQKRLCEVVATLLAYRRSFVVASARTQPTDPRKHEELRGFLQRLAAQMVRHGQVLIETTSLPPEDHAALTRGLGEGWLRETPSVTAPHRKFVAFADVELCKRVLADWVLSVGKGIADLLDDARRLPQLIDGVAKCFVEMAWRADAGRLAEWLAVEGPVAERLTSQMVEQLADHRDRLRLFIAHALAQGSFNTVRGLASGAREFIDRSRYELAGELLDSLANQPACRLNDSEAKRFRIEMANEQGRLLIRRGMRADAEAHFRRTLEQAEAFGDRTLTSVVANNLSRTILDAPTPIAGQRDEAICILRHNIERLTEPDQARHLAATYSNLGDAYAARDPVQAESYFRRDVDICKDFRDDMALVDALDALAVFLTDQRRHAEAEQVYREELALCHRFFDLRRHARGLANLGWCFFRQARPQNSGQKWDTQALDNARRTLAESCKLFSSIDEPRLYAPALENLGRVRYLLEQRSDGVATLQASILEYRKFPDGRQTATEIQSELDEIN